MSTSLSGAHSSALQSGSLEEALTTETQSFLPQDLALMNLPRSLGDGKTQPFRDSKTLEVQDMVRSDTRRFCWGLVYLSERCEEDKTEETIMCLVFVLVGFSISLL